MNMLEALRLAKDEGKLVRPVCWNQWHVRWPDGSTRPDMHWHDDGVRYTMGLQLDSDAEIFGEWEVVDG